MCAMNEFTKKVQKRVEFYRNRGETLEKIAERADVSRMYLYNIMQGKDVNPPILVAEKIATGLGFTMRIPASTE